MAATEQPLRLDKLSDQELTTLFLAEPGRKDLTEDLAARCVKKIKSLITVLVVVKGLCPSEEDRYAFADDAFARAQEKFWRGIGKLRSPEKLNAWLKSVARTAVFEEWDTIVGRGGQPRTFESLDTAGSSDYAAALATPGETRVVDAGTPFNSRYWHDPTLFVLDRELGEILLRALHIHAEGSKRDADCALWMEKQSRENLSIEEIAYFRGTTKHDVWHMFHHDQESLYLILTERFGLSPRDLP